VKFSFGSTNIAITHSDASTALADVARKLGAGVGFSLATINLDHLVKLHRSASFRDAYQKQDMVVADGNPIVWLSYLAGTPVSLVPGSDLVLQLVRTAVEQGRPVAMVGSTDAALQGAAVTLQKEFPGLAIGPQIAPPFGFDPRGDEARRILADLAQQGPCLCLIALGAPKQEEFASLGRELAPLVGFASVGAGVDFLSGHQIRAPEWTRRLAMEWVWRMMQSPKRMGPRYAACAAILPSQIAQALRQRGNAA
jgi:exopolysaccharide biosynthesis WecB/TagA/CpsF family protein